MSERTCPKCGHVLADTEPLYEHEVFCPWPLQLEKAKQMLEASRTTHRVQFQAQCEHRQKSRFNNGLWRCDHCGLEPIEPPDRV